MKSNEIREKFLSFFEEKGHKRYPSSSLIPDDPTLLLTTAGMVQFKPYFLGLLPAPHTRITTVQKCARTSDIERVGETARHLTFFEMLGNFSIGDYYKEEAIEWACEFLFERMGLDRSRFWATIYLDDEEAYKIWSEKMGFPDERIVRLGEDDNFWAAGPTGPCGPCSELIVDRGEQFGCGSPDCKPGCDCDRFLEIWNLVFMQYERDEQGNLHPLPRKNIDTGMGLERIAMLMQKKDSVFETDLLRPILDAVTESTGAHLGHSEETDRALKVITDHIKAATFLIADGVFPANEGRGYVLRRLIRRAVRFSRMLEVEDAYLYRVTDVVKENFGDQYPELKENSSLITELVKKEEEKFLRVIDRGSELLEEEMKKASKTREISGEIVYRLYDTYGFPPELTREIALEKGYSVDEEGFKKALEEAREKSRSTWKGREFSYDPGVYSQVASKYKVEFVGYEKDEAETEILALLKKGKEISEAAEGDEVEVVIASTPFYPESGGQVADTGTITGDEFELEVIDVQKPVNELIVHFARVKKGKVNAGARVIAMIDSARRRDTERNHTATHILQWALRLVLGDFVKQSGSYVSPDYFRFDYPYEEPLTREQLYRIEELVNAKIAENHPVRKYETTLQHAREIGAIALFGEKYGEYVRVVEVGNFSRELCGGTHVNQTSEICLFKILSERSIGSGMRRIEAVTGRAAMRHVSEELKKLDELTELLKTDRTRLVKRVEELLDENKKLRKSKITGEKESLRDIFNHLKNNSITAGKTVILKYMSENQHSLKELKELVDLARENLNSFALVAGAVKENKAAFFVALSRDLVENGINAVEIVRQAATHINGGGGGTPRLAEAGGRNVEGLPKALDEAIRLLKESIE